MTRRKPSKLPQILALGGFGFLVLAVILIKTKPSEEARVQHPDVLPQAQLEQVLQADRPALAFFHSNTCQQCIEMIGIVGEVYPEFVDSVSLVDVNVYDERNASLLQQVRLQFIPTLIFYDHDGQAEVFVGVMPAEQLQQRLAALAGGS
jgi:thioredoxin-like negative regulator of GroEL